MNELIISNPGKKNRFEYLQLSEWTGILQIVTMYALQIISVDRLGTINWKFNIPKNITTKKWCLRNPHDVYIKSPPQTASHFYMIIRFYKFN